MLELPQDLIRNKFFKSLPIICYFLYKFSLIVSTPFSSISSLMTHLKKILAVEVERSAANLHTLILSVIDFFDSYLFSWFLVSDKSIIYYNLPGNNFIYQRRLAFACLYFISLLIVNDKLLIINHSVAKNIQVFLHVKNLLFLFLTTVQS